MELKYLVVSDSHGDRDILVDLINYYESQVDGLFHCGDSELEQDDPVWRKMLTVKGNCDYSPGFKTVQVVKKEGDTIYMTHGHLFNVRFGLTQLAKAAKEQKANIALFGHTHELGVKWQDGILFLNPGSISQPRGQYQEKTYAIIESTDKEYFVKFYDRSKKKVPGLDFTFKKN